MSEEDFKRGYFAGILDGEGSIYISSLQKRSINGIAVYNLAVNIGITEVDPLLFIQESFGGSLYHKIRHDYHVEQFGVMVSKDLYTLSWTGKKAQQLLLLIKDKLIVKKERAELACQFPIGDKNAKYTNEEILGSGTFSIIFIMGASCLMA